MDKKKSGKTIILTTHNMKVAEEICDRVAFIVDGKISLIDSPRELMIKQGEKVVKIEYKEAGVIQSMDFPSFHIFLFQSLIEVSVFSYEPCFFWSGLYWLTFGQGKAFTV